MTATTRTAEEFKVTELGPLPPEWEVVRLGDVAKVSSGGSAPQGKDFFSGHNPFIRVQHLELESDTIRRWDLITDVAVNKCGLRLYSKGTIVFPKSGASIYLEKRAILPIDAYLVGHLCAVISRSPLVDQNFLFYYLRFVRLSEQKAEGYPTLNLTEIKERIIAYPPLPEQKCIAYFLSTVQTAIEKTQAVIQATRELKKSLMNHLFTYGPVSIGEAEGVPLKETEIGLVPEEWEVKPLVDIATLQRGKDLPKQKQVWGKYPVVGASGVMAYHNQAPCRGPGIVTGRSGSIGKLTYIEEDYWPHNTGLYVKDFHNNNPKFTYYLLHLIDFRKYATGVSVPTLNRNVVHAAMLPVPPIEVQRHIADILTTLDRRIETGESKKKALESLFRTLLSKLMTGKTRVNDLEVSV